MPRLITAVAFIAASGIASASSHDLPTDTRCFKADHALSLRLHDVLAHDAPNPSALNRIMARMTSARFDCKHGRIERGLQTYADADAALRALEDSTLLSTARSGTATSVH